MHLSLGTCAFESCAQTLCPASWVDRTFGELVHALATWLSTCDVLGGRGENREKFWRRSVGIVVGVSVFGTGPLKAGEVFEL